MIVSLFGFLLGAQNICIDIIDTLSLSHPFLKAIGVLLLIKDQVLYISHLTIQVELLLIYVDLFQCVNLLEGSLIVLDYISLNSVRHLLTLVSLCNYRVHLLRIFLLTPKVLDLDPNVIPLHYLFIVLFLQTRGTLRFLGQILLLLFLSITVVNGFQS